MQYEPGNIPAFWKNGPPQYCPIEVCSLLQLNQRSRDFSESAPGDPIWYRFPIDDVGFRSYDRVAKVTM